LAVNIVAKEKGFLFLHYLEVNCWFYLECMWRRSLAISVEELFDNFSESISRLQQL
jgi:hypothetical protein